MGILNDTDYSNITLEEYSAMQTILNSDRCGILVRSLCTSIVDLDQEGAGYLVSLLADVSRLQARKMSERMGNMRNFVYMLGRNLSSDTVSTGSRKGKPAFLTAKFSERLEHWMWYVLAFVYDYANFQESAKKSAASGGRYGQLTASSVCEQDELARSYVERFRKFLDDLETKDMKDLVSPTIFDTYPGMKEFVDWCRENRKVWDDMGDAK